MADSDNLTRVTSIGDHQLVLTEPLLEVAYKDDVAIYLFSIIPSPITTGVTKLDFDAQLELYRLDETRVQIDPVPYSFSIANNPTPDIGTPAGTTVGQSILAYVMSTAVTARSWADHILNPTPIYDQLAP